MSLVYHHFQIRGVLTRYIPSLFDPPVGRHVAESTSTVESSNDEYFVRSSKVEE